jgi:glycosyltransferase involved in cell wall biosynthesis
MKHPLRILVAHNVSRQRTGGMSRLMSFVHDQVALAGHSVDYFCSEDFPQALQGRSARFAFPLLVVRHARAAAQRGEPYDVINVHEPCGAAITLLKGAAGHPRVVVTSYGVETRGWRRLLEESRLGREKVRLLSRLSWPATGLWQARLALSHADHVFCSNMEDREYLVSEYRIPPERITRIHSGADCIHASLGGMRDYSQAKTLLFAGTWLKRKGTFDLVPAFTELAAKHSQLNLVVLNGGVQDNVIKQSFPERIRSRVICQRADPERGVAEAMSKADIYLLPSLFEGTPLTLVEAMFGGMPIVTTATCGMKDVIADRRNGLLIPIRSSDAIVAAVECLLGDSALRERLGQTARADAVEKYNWRSVAEPIRLVYEELCAVKPNGSRH